MRHKSIPASLLAIVMTLNLAFFGVSADSFSDTAEHWASKEIQAWSDYGVIGGSEGQFRPDDAISRAEIAVIMNKLMGYQEKADNQFSDLNETWYTEAILKGVANDILKGSDGMVRPADKISRQEFSVVVCRAFGIAPVDGETKFGDDAEIAPWAKGYVKALSERGYIKGLDENSFGPKANISRASVVKLLDNIVAKLYDKEGSYSEKIEGSAVINKAGVVLKDAEIAGDLILAEGIGNGDVKLENVKVKGRILAKGGGKNSIYFNNVDVNGALVVNKKGGEIRIVSEGSTKISVVSLESGAIVLARNLKGGKIEKIEIPANLAKGQNIVLDGSFGKVENNASGAKLQISGSVENLVLKEKTEVTGNAKIIKVETSTADSTLNGKKVEEKKEQKKDQKNPKPSAPAPESKGGSGGGSGGGANSGNGGSSGNSGNSGTENGGNSGPGNGGNPGAGNQPDQNTGFTVSFEVNGGTAVESIKNVAKGSKISKPNNPTKMEGSQNLGFLGWYKEASLENEWNFNTDVVNDNITLYAKWEGFQPAVNVDPRFAEGYPKASINSEGKLEIKVKLKEAPAEPAEVFMVAGFYNHDKDVTTKAVLEGRFGYDDEFMEAMSYPYLQIRDAGEHVVTTEVQVRDQRGVGSAIVLKVGNRLSEKPIYIEYVGKIAGELDELAPDVLSAYISRDGNKILLWFEEHLDVNSLPNGSAFAISDGTQVERVKIENFNRVESCVTLQLKSSVANPEGLTVNYSVPANNPLQDLVGNDVRKIENRPILKSEPKISNINISSEGRYITMDIMPGLRGPVRQSLYWGYGLLSNASKKLNPEDIFDSHALSGSEYSLRIDLNKNMPKLVPGGKFFFRIAGELKTYGGDSVTEILGDGSPSALNEALAKPQKITYDKSEKKLSVKFEQDQGLFASNSYHSLASARFMVKKGEKTYYLRGTAKSITSEKSIEFGADELKHIPMDFWAGSALTYSYEGLSFHPFDALVFPSGKPYAGFQNVNIEVVE